MAKQQETLEELLDTLTPELEHLELGNLDELVKSIEGENDNAFTNQKKLCPSDELHLPTIRLVTKEKRRAYLDAGQLKRAMDLLQELPGEEETVHMICGGSFEPPQMIAAIHRIAGKPFDEMIITTLGFNAKALGLICHLYDEGQIKKGSVLASTFFRAQSQEIYWEGMRELKKRGIRLEVCRNHTKIMLLKVGAAHYVAEGSANIRSSQNLEQLILTRSRPLYQFHREWIHHVFKQVDLAPTVECPSPSPKNKALPEKPLIKPLIVKPPRQKPSYRPRKRS